MNFLHSISLLSVCCLALCAQPAAANTPPAPPKQAYQKPEQAIISAREIISMLSKDKDPFGLYQNPDLIPKVEIKPPPAPIDLNNQDPTPNTKALDALDLLGMLEIRWVDAQRQTVNVQFREDQSQLKTGAVFTLRHEGAAFQYRLFKIEENRLIFSLEGSNRLLSLDR